MAQVILATEWARSRSPQLSNAQLINLMTEVQGLESKGKTPLFGCSGIAAFKDTSTVGRPTGPCRGWVNFNDTAWGVFGESLYRIDEVGVAVWSGGGITGSRPVGLSQNGQQIIIVNGTAGWTYDSVNGLVKITSPNFYGARTVSFMDGFFVLDRRGTNQFFISSLYDGQTYDALAFATAEAAPGFMTGVAANLQFLYIFTSSHIEIWYDAGTQPFPFQRYSGGAIPYGCLSPYTIINQDGALWFLGRDKIVYRLDANQPKRVSTHPIETLIAEETEADLALAEMFTLTIQGHKLIFLTLRGGDATLCYDVSTEKWHARDSVDERFNSLGRWRGRFALPVYGKTLVGDAYEGLVGALDWGIYREYDWPMRGQVETLNQHLNRHKVFCSRFELDMQFGTGTIADPDPEIRLRRSVDGGMTWGGWQPPRSIGGRGDFARRAIWRRQGSGRQMNWQLQYTGAQPVTIIGADADIQEGFA